MPNPPDLEAVRQIIFEHVHWEPDCDQVDPTREGCGRYVDYIGPQPSVGQMLVFAAELYSDWRA